MKPSLFTAALTVIVSVAAVALAMGISLGVVNPRTVGDALVIAWLAVCALLAIAAVGGIVLLMWAGLVAWLDRDAPEHRHRYRQPEDDA